MTRIFLKASLFCRHICKRMFFRFSQKSFVNSWYSKILPSFPGMLLEEEISNLKNLVINERSSSSIAVFGGSKISTKIKIVDFYLNKFDKVLIGGAMANTFLVAKEKK